MGGWVDGIAVGPSPPSIEIGWLVPERQSKGRQRFKPVFHPVHEGWSIT